MTNFLRPQPLTWTKEVDMLDARKLVAEFFGTAILVIIAVGVATENFGFKLFGGSVAAGVVTTALAFGLVLMALAYAIGPISGCHVNPAVTIGFVAAGRMKIVEGISYMVAQVIGAIAGATVLFTIFSQVPGYSRHIEGMGTDGYGKYSLVGLKQPGAFITEVVLTFIFVTVVLFATHKASIGGAAGLAIGMSLVVVHLIGIPLTGTSVNPARSIGPALFVGGHAMSQLWLFIVAPLIGGLVAALVHMALVHEKAHENAPAEAAA
jgi:aquaporin Z